MGHSRSQKLVVMDTHWFEAEVAEAAVASNLDFHSCSHLLNRVIQEQYIKGWKIHVIHKQCIQ